MTSADLAICHLEVPLAPPGRPATGYPLFGAPLSLPAALAATGWDRCSTASNHSIDQRTIGVSTTLDALDAAGLGHSGTARTAEEAATIPQTTVNGVRVAHLSYTYGLNGLKLPKDEPWRVHRIAPDRIRRDASQARREGVEIVIVSMHWGQEYRSQPTTEQRRVATAIMADGTIDLVIGHHAHVLQPFQQYDGRWVLFGLGNHLSAQVGSSKRPAGTQDGAIAEIVFAETEPGVFRAASPIAHPTWVHPVSRRVLLTDVALADPATPPSTARALRASLTRFRSILGPWRAT